MVQSSFFRALPHDGDTDNLRGEDGRYSADGDDDIGCIRDVNSAFHSDHESSREADSMLSFRHNSSVEISRSSQELGSFDTMSAVPASQEANSTDEEEQNEVSMDIIKSQEVIETLI